MNEAIILTLAISTFTSLIFAIRLYGSVSRLKEELDKSQKDLEKAKADLTMPIKSPIEIEPGDSAIVPDYGLTTKGDKPVAFTVTYEVEILEVAAKRVKVKAIDYRSHDSYAKDPANKQSIINFMQNTWLEKREVEMVMDEKKKRSIKLNQLGI